MKLRLNEDGFSLVEMLVVLALVAITMVIALPYAPRSGDERTLETATQTIASHLRETQARALFSNQSQILTIDLKQRQVELGDSRKIYFVPKGVEIKITTAKNEIIENQASFRFFADGGSTGGSIRLQVANSVRVISLNWLHGGVNVSKAVPQ